MKALVTGAKGFVGRHMVDELVSRGYAVIGVDLRTGSDALDWFGSNSTTFDLVVHCAASQPHRAAIDGDPTNLIRNLHLDSAMFEWAIRTGTRVLYLSSCAAYPARLQRHDGRLLRESDADADPVDAYAFTKLAGERMAASVANRIPVHVVRPFSGYGEDQDERFPFGAFLGRVRNREDPFVVWGDGSQVRDWIHIDDVVRGALAVVDADYRKPVNLCTGVGTSMTDLVGLICRAAGFDPQLELRLDRPAGVAYRVGDPKILHQFYEPAVSLAEGVARALA